MPHIDILKKNKRISQDCKKRLAKASQKYSQKIDGVYKEFETHFIKLQNAQRRRLKSVINQHDKEFARLSSKRKLIYYPVLRKRIIEEISEYYGFKSEEIKIQNRGEVAKSDCRQVIYYFLYLHKLGTLQEIGNEFNNRSPSAVFCGIQTVRDLLDSDKLFINNINNISILVDEIIEEYSKK